jgi:hypothetical protein
VKRFWILSAILVATTVLLAVCTQMGDGAVTRYLGMPVVAWGNFEDSSWIAMGGKGVIVLGAGFGLVEYGLYGAGALFACGQVAGGLLAFGQLAVGPIFVCGQLVFGMLGLGQVFVGGWGIGQGKLAKDGMALLKHLDEDLDDVLRFRSRRSQTPA